MSMRGATSSPASLYIDICVMLVKYHRVCVGGGGGREERNLSECPYDGLEEKCVQLQNWLEKKSQQQNKNWT